MVGISVSPVILIQFNGGHDMNKAMVIGNLGNDPEVRYTKNRNETPVATFSVATTERWKDADGNKQEHTEWHRVVAWGSLAEDLRRTPEQRLQGLY